MGKKIKVWLDSGANIHSCRKQIVDLADIGVTDDGWDAMTDDQKEAEMREIAFEQSDWGFCEVDSEGDD